MRRARANGETFKAGFKERNATAKIATARKIVEDCYKRLFLAKRILTSLSLRETKDCSFGVLFGASGTDNTNSRKCRQF